MKISELSVRRPVFATVLSLFLVLIGLASAVNLAVREYPDIDPPIVSIDTTYRGASAEVIETRVTQVIEDQVAGLEGIVKLTSTSRDERSTVTHRVLARTATWTRPRTTCATAWARGGAAAAGGRPAADRQGGQRHAARHVAHLTSDRPQHAGAHRHRRAHAHRPLLVVEGVARVQLGGARRYAMRVWLDREAMAARGITSEDITAALRRENVELPAGRLESAQREFTLRTRTGLTRPRTSRRWSSGAAATAISCASATSRRCGRRRGRAQRARANQDPGHQPRHRAAVQGEHRRGLARRPRPWRRSCRRCPRACEISINFDRAAFIEASMLEVLKALGFALTLVLLVIYLFLGNIRATLVPALTIPICVIATFSVMALFGYSINVLILLGLVLAIGLVVDDAIVVLENIWRRIEEGEPPLLAAVERQPRDRLRGDRHHAGAGVRVPADLVHPGQRRPAVPRVRRGGRGGGDHLQPGRAHAHPHAELEAVQGRRAARLADHAVIERAFKRLATCIAACSARSCRAPGRCSPGRCSSPCGRGPVPRSAQRVRAPRGPRHLLHAAPRPPGASLEYTEAYAQRMEEILMRYVENGEARCVLLRVPGGWGGHGRRGQRARHRAAGGLGRSASASVEEIAAEVRGELAELPGVQARVITPAGLGVRGATGPCRWCSAAPSTRSWPRGATS
jgi:multidrug efflux pump